MRKLFLLAVSILAVYTANAQFSDITYGAKGGFNVTNVTNISQHNKISFHLGGFAEWKLSDIFAVQSEFIYSRQGARDKWDSEAGTVKLKTRMNYLNIPILAKYYIIDDLSIDFGPQLGFSVGKKAKTKVDGNSSKHKLDHANTFDLSLGIGTSYNIESIILSARYNFGLTNVLDRDYFDDKSKNHVFQVSIGYCLSDLF